MDYYDWPVFSFTLVSQSSHGLFILTHKINLRNEILFRKRPQTHLTIYVNEYVVKLTQTKLTTNSN